MNAITEENWAANADRREHNRAVQVLNDHKRLLGKERYVRVDDKTILGFSVKKKADTIKKCVERFKDEREEL